VIGRDLVELAAPPAGGRLLDVGTGTGVVVEAAGEAVGPGGVAVGVDSSVPMLTVGLRSRPALNLAAAEAIDLPFRDATFDVVTANFVLSHFARWDTALFDCKRVLKSGGRLGATAWAEREDEFQRTWRELCEEVAGHELLEDARQRAMPWEERFADKARLDDTLRQAGFRPVRVERREYRFHLAREDYVQGRETTSSGRFVRGMLGPEGWERFRARARQAFAERFPEQITDFRDVLLAVGTNP
jgi:ubiquinone/menaquinone biosynthesis C-methylase UbiE